MEINKQAKYDGYIWKSDKTQPWVLKGEEYNLQELDGDINPFVIEGQLWDATHSISISIRYADGKHIISTQRVTKDDLEGKGQTTQVRYISHIKDVSKLCFLRYWKAEVDEFCERFEALRPGKLVFVGFDNFGKED